MSITPPDVGQEPWGTDLNAYLTSLDERVSAAEADILGMGVSLNTMGQRVSALEAEVADLTDQVVSQTSQISDLASRLDALENQPEHIYNSYAWQYSNQSPPPTGNQVRFDNADLSQATVMVMRLIDSDGADRTPIFQQLSVGDHIRINDWDNAATIHRFNVTATPTLDASDVTIPVAWVSGSGTIPNAKANVAFLLTLEF